MNRAVWVTPTQLDAIVTVAWVAFAIVIGVIVHRVVYALLRRWAERRHSAFATAVIHRTSRPAAYIVPLLAILAVIPSLDIPERWQNTVLQITGPATIAAIAWTIVAAIRLWSDVTVARHRIDIEDNLLARQLGTRVDILSRVAIGLVAVVALGAVLMTIAPIRAFGATLLASAGLVGIVAGIAARPLFENLLAGIQLALTQPIRIDDVVVVETQFGRIEEIHSTYVVVCLWDLRRLVVPLTYFINTPFENWTRRTANVIGEVYFVADWTLDIEGVRAELPRILARTPLWDQRTQTLQVTDATDRGVHLRALVSARNAGELFDLRCFVREALVAFMRETQPDALPRLRLVQPLDGVAADGPPLPVQDRGG